MKKFIALVVMLCAVLISSSASAADWVWVRSDDAITVYVDNNSISRDYNYRGYVFRAFTKWVYSETGRQEFIEHYRSNGRSLPRGIYNLSYTISLYYFKLENSMEYSSLMNVNSYDKNGNPILNLCLSKDSIQWEIIPPDSIGEIMFDVIRARVPN